MLYPSWDNLPPIMRGFTWERYYLFEVHGEPFDFAGYDVSAEILKTFDSLSTIIRMTTAGGEVALENGIIKLKLTPTQTQGLTSGSYVWVASLISGSTTDVYPIIVGNVRVITCDKVGS